MDDDGDRDTPCGEESCYCMCGPTERSRHACGCDCLRDHWAARDLLTDD